MNEQEFTALAAGHALNALSPEDERSYRAALLEHPEWSDIVAQDAETAAALAGGVAQETPPLALRGALLSLIARTPQHRLRPDAPVDAGFGLESSGTDSHDFRSVIPGLTPAAERPADSDDASLADAHAPAPRVEPTPTDTVQTVARRSWMRGMFALAASLALLVTLGFGAALIGQQLGRSPAVIALDRIEDAADSRTAGVTLEGGGEATAVWSESLGEAVLVADGLPTLPDDQTYQLWFIRGEEIISAGLFDTDPEGEATSLLDGTVEPGDLIAVSVEPSGGSDQPTTEPIAAIPTDA